MKFKKADLKNLFLIIEILLKKGADINSIDNEGFTVLMGCSFHHNDK